ncbi:pyrimidine dimer DNA glycosylase/endonuclease V [Piscirickettsia litoralis]|uniref:Uncharacterized protein n=1 Tax=Piscirickettsia litoralis TaxID=1891921 RepID=A0ABX3A1B8_9GAMM|nr:pyrimidine dimer DNA glycosylase/endonuclease V [Piscirickettsia litoralis]ODN41423.1 hypothetical protein BGC07_16810 [Piscirickettsia litoralis]
MNIFYLDNDIKQCAQYHCDAHVVKMILESAQMLCTVLHQQGIEAPYRPTHANHPCVVWLGESLDNWLWLKQLAFALNDEYRYRYNKKDDHKSIGVVKELSLPPLKSLGITERPQTMPEQYKVTGDPVAAYRQFYLAEKSHLLKYTKRNFPSWVISQSI